MTHLRPSNFRLRFQLRRDKSPWQAGGEGFSWTLRYLDTLGTTAPQVPGFRFQVTGSNSKPQISNLKPQTCPSPFIPFIPVKFSLYRFYRNRVSGFRSCTFAKSLSRHVDVSAFLRSPFRCIAQDSLLGSQLERCYGTITQNTSSDPYPQDFTENGLPGPGI